MDEEERGAEIALKIDRTTTLSFILLIVGVVIGLLLSFSIRVTGLVILSPEDAGKKAIDYINENLAEPGETAALVSVEEMGELYKIITRYKGVEIPVYLTKDGKYLLLQAFDTTQPLKKETEKFDAPDRERVNVKFFVMSFCPYGDQAEEALAPVFELLGEEKVEWEPHYVIYSNYRGYPDYCLDENETYCSMHGIEELRQNLRELCVWKYFDHAKWWKFVKAINHNCTLENVDECWKPIAESIGLEVEKIEDCVENEALDLLQEELELNKRYNVRGSPTVFINDVRYEGSRTPEAYKQAICSGFVEPPKECEQRLESATVSPQGTC